MGSKAAKAGRTDEAIFTLYSNGYKTGKDAYLYNFSRDACTKNARKMVDDYLGARRELDEFKNGSPTDEITHEITLRHSSHVRWDRELKRRVRQRVSTEFSNGNVREVSYRPFVKQYLYADYTFSQAPGQTRDIFPDKTSENRVICVPGIGSTKPFSALVADTMPDLELISKGQCFPRYRYRERAEVQRELPGIESAQERDDNISDTALRAFRVRYNDNTITKDGISITSTAFCTHLPTGHASPTIWPRNYRASRSLPIFMPLPRLGANSRNSISVTRTVQSIRWRSRPRTPETHARRIFGLATGPCDSLTMKRRSSPSTSM